MALAYAQFAGKLLLVGIEATELPEPSAHGFPINDGSLSGSHTEKGLDLDCIVRISYSLVTYDRLSTLYRDGHGRQRESLFGNLAWQSLFMGMESTVYGQKGAKRVKPQGTNHDGLGRLVARRLLRFADRIFAEVREERRLQNEPEVEIRKTLLGFRLQEEQQLAEKVRLLPPIEELKGIRFKKSLYWLAALAIFISECVFIYIAVKEYAPGWQAYAFMPVALLIAFLTDLTLRMNPSRRLQNTLCLTAGGALMVGALSLGLIRAVNFAYSLSRPTPMVIEGVAASPTIQAPPDSTIAFMTVMMGFVMVLMAAATPVVLGLLVHEAQSLNYRNGLEMRSRLEELRSEVVAEGQTILHLENGPELRERQHRIEFLLEILDDAEPYLLMDKQEESVVKEETRRFTRSRATRLSLLLALLLTSLGSASAAEPPNVVVLLDLSKSTAVESHRGATEFQKNLNGAARILGSLGPETRITIAGITDDSFGKRLVLLSAHTADDPGPFQVHLRNQQRQLIESWRQITQELTPTFLKTDVLGAIALASLYCQEQGPARCELIIFSDMRHVAHGIDLETPDRLDVSALLDRVEREVGFADLSGATVSVFGVHPVAKNPTYWNDLRRFWEEYFRRTGATLRTFSMSGESPDPAR